MSGSPTVPASDWEGAFRPAILADVALVLPPLLRLRASPDLSAGDRLRVDLRLADVARRFLPEEALALLDALPATARAEGPLDAAFLRASALLEAGRTAEAALLVPSIPTAEGLRAVVRGRLAWAEGRLEEALLHLDEALLRTEHPELRGEALGYRARALHALGRDAHADLDALERLCDAHRAGFTQTLFRLVRAGLDDAKLPGMADAFLRGARLWIEGQLVFGVEKDRAKVAPLPLHVHGAAMRYRDQPERYANAILFAAALAWRAGDRVPAYETAWYGGRIAERRFGAEAAAPIWSFLAELEGSVPAVERDAIRAAVSARAAEPRPT